jgi:elongator complex protein 3
MEKPDICREIISLFFSGDRDIGDCIREVCGRHRTGRVPKHSEILAAASAGEREKLLPVLRVKPTRTLSGVAPVAVMTSPSPCPHGRCLPCPGGPDHPFGSPQSYTGDEPAAVRGREHLYDPHHQVQDRIRQFELLGHHAEKAELIVMGGTITARSREYQEWFVRECVRGMNRYRPSDEEGEDPFEANERSAIRCIGITFETRPDRCGTEEVRLMLSLGVTKVELGVQHTDDRVLAINRRGCTTADTAAANRILRDAGLKVGFHMMPNLPGSTIEEDRRMFRELFENPAFRPDFLKIYPTLVTPGSGIEEWWRDGRYEPYGEDEMVELVAYAKSILPEYVRLQRVQRDIPARHILAGSRHSNFRQLAAARLRARGLRCRCIRCREIGRRPDTGRCRTELLTYECAGGTEHFIQMVAGDSLAGFARLRFPGSAVSGEANGAALLRELHVYGRPVPIGSAPDADQSQHRSIGAELLGRAEEIAGDAGFPEIAVMSGCGVRPYYRRQGYRRAGPYMMRDLR